VNSTLDALADGLAENGYSVTEHFFKPEGSNKHLGFTRISSWIRVFKKAGIGKNQNHHINESIRGDYIHWIDKNSAPDPLRVYLDKLGHLVQSLNESLFLSLKDYEIHLTIYPAGTFLQAAFWISSTVMITGNCRHLLFDADWTIDHGGQLRMFLPDEKNRRNIAHSRKTRLFSQRSDRTRSIAGNTNTIKPNWMDTGSIHVPEALVKNPGCLTKAYGF
jgi:SM-20-related protein